MASDHRFAHPTKGPMLDATSEAANKSYILIRERRPSAEEYN